MDGLNPSRAAAPVYGARRGRRLGAHRERKQRAFFVEGEELQEPIEEQDENTSAIRREAQPKASPLRHPDPDEETGHRLDVTA